jgi:hypothetical protein
MEALDLGLTADHRRFPHVRYWHLADIDFDDQDVRFKG